MSGYCNDCGSLRLTRDSFEEQAEQAEARAEAAEASLTAYRHQHDRVLSWPPQDFVEAAAVIAQAAASLARQSMAGGAAAKALIAALDTLQKHRSQQAAENDTLRAEVERLTLKLDDAQKRHEFPLLMSSISDLRAEVERLTREKHGYQIEAAQHARDMNAEAERTYRCNLALTDARRLLGETLGHVRSTLSERIRAFLVGEPGK